MTCALLPGLAAVPHAAPAEGMLMHAELAEAEIFLGKSATLAVRIEGVRQAAPEFMTL